MPAHALSNNNTINTQNNTYMLIHDLIPVLQLSVSPVILISGMGLVLLSMINRYNHIVDASRKLSAMIKKSNDDNSNCYTQLDIIFLRAQVLRRAVIFAVLSLLLVAILIIVLFLVCLLHLEAGFVICGLFIGSMVTFSIALIAFLVDINMSLRAIALEINPKLQNAL